MRVSVIFLLLFWLGIATFHLTKAAGGSGNGNARSKSLAGSKSMSRSFSGSNTPVTPKRPGVSKKPSDYNRFRGIVDSLGNERKALQQPTRRYSRDDSFRPDSPSGTGSPTRYSITDEMTPEEAEAKCALELSDALKQMDLGNLLEETLNPGMASELESQLIGHFEHGAEPDDFLIDITNFRSAQKSVEAKPAVLKQVQPMVFRLNSDKNALGEEGMTMQRRCSKRCFWLYGFIVVPVQREEKGKEGVTISNQRIVIPITEGEYKRKILAHMSSKVMNKPSPGIHVCTCLITEVFVKALKKHGIVIQDDFVDQQNVSSGEAMKFLSQTLAKARNGLQLMEHEEFVELVTFEILKHIRPGKTPKEIMSEIRNGVTAANADYRKLMQGEIPKNLVQSRSFFKRLLTTKSFGRKNSRS